MTKVLILSPLKTGNGNYSTVDRIRHQLTTRGYQCLLEDPDSFRSVADFLKRLQKDNVKVLVGIHAFRSGNLMRESSIPYILILGGTDIHVFCDRKSDMMVMTDAVHKAKHVVCFHQTIKDRALFLWPDLRPARLKVISQAVETKPSSFNLLHHLQQHHPHLQCLNNQDRLNIFLLVAGIRPVKNPTFLISTFQEWHSKEENVILVIIGHRLNQEYSRNVFEPEVNKAPGVVYIPGIPIEDVHAAMSQSTVLVNTSDSEGMCLAILEAMQLGLPVMARDIPANRAIVSDGHTGLLFSSVEIFQEKARHLLASPELRRGLVSRARHYIHDQHNMEVEQRSYTSLIDQCLNDFANGFCGDCGDVNIETKFSKFTNNNAGEPISNGDLHSGKNDVTCDDHRELDRMKLGQQLSGALTS